MEIIQRIVPAEKRPKYNVGGKQVEFKMVPEYITIHETDNTAIGANDEAHARLQERGNSRQASWHLQIDMDSCYQSLPFDVAGIHAGDGVNGTGNRKSIAIEICVNLDGNYEKAILNAAWLVAFLMKKFNIPISKVVTHKHWSGKNCPRNLLSRWNAFINMVQAELNAKVVEAPKTQVGTVVTTTGNIGVGAVVTVAQHATHYATGEPIASHVRGSNYKVIQVKDWVKGNSKKAFLLEGIMSWVWEQDIVGFQVQAPKPAPQPASPKPTTRKIVLPASDPTWTVYKLGRPCVKSNPANIAGVLKPAKFGGLNYEILKDNGNGIYEIQTGDFGRVQIYAAPSTGAVIK
jgi:N-acetylmuramoyl-L-alanine amidase